MCTTLVAIFFFFNDTATTEIYTLSLHDALPICATHGLSKVSGSCGPGSSNRRTTLRSWCGWGPRSPCSTLTPRRGPTSSRPRSEEHTSELQSQSNLVCRLLLEKKKKNKCLSRDH